MERTITCSTPNCKNNKNGKCVRYEIEINSGECYSYEDENEEDVERDFQNWKNRENRQ